MNRKFITFILIIIAITIWLPTVFAYRVARPIKFTNLQDPSQINALNETLSQLWDISNGRFSIDIVTSNPDGSLKGDVGDMILFNNSGTYYLEINTTGQKVWRGILLSDTP